MTKFKSILLIGALASLSAVRLLAQTNTPIGAPTNNAPVVPGMAPVSIADALGGVPTVPIAQETIGLTVGTIIGGASTVKNVEDFDYSFTKNFFAGVEIINSAQAGSVIESAGIRAGVYKSLTTARVYGYLGGRRNWSAADWEGKAGLGLAYTPFQSQTNSIMHNFSAVVDEGIVISKNKTAPPEETEFGIRYSF